MIEKFNAVNIDYIKTLPTTYYFKISIKKSL
jgi:hypothetical protein